ncbi:BglG family transcriptional antiterminator [Enterococcus haemoperoxidus ATCC BAA-382]|uniref:BglG family transcriptional antiterminator n=1 Tax=Enterococcus haemoperoxidus ATCC BAA-382 TaxID=1158608 RepID=R2T181_9ENTE|nr:HTH domain-containing protein [Enterococcus haemoperoxidus]EOH93989.1 BglG family transcriptional antiterminator [Enterococcus haemoperoxidus ATCC BAA-382]EOT63297.1 BglG family transcriptional antiterminator [Enterococcus haemoperoxidus ATCC BAA-382]OJG54034.1 BglG family transcriptional antiterminator [Enterococcus haemoperoxidus]
MSLHLSKREIKILLLLLDLEDSVTTKELAETFHVSVRTIKYDLENVRDWFKEQNVLLKTRRNKGIWLEIPDSERLTLKNEIIEVERFETYPDQELRVNQLIFRLLLASNYLTSQELADDLQVSRNTIISDLDRVEELIHNYELALNRQSRQGFSIVGEESKIRLLMEYITQKEITEYDIYQIMSYFVQSGQQKKMQEVHVGVNTIFQKIYQVALKEMTGLLDPSLFDQFNYAEILSITLRVAIAASRMQLHHTVGGYKMLTNQKVLQQKQELPFLLMKKVFNHYELPLLADEYFYIYSDVFVANNQKDIVGLTEELIKDVSEEINFPFYRDRQLFTNLFAHLSLRLTKKHLFINEYNPFVDDIKAKYPQLFSAIQLASQSDIEGSVLLINDSFIAYIALHFLVAYEKNLHEVNVVRIVYVCSTGLGVTSLIEQKIMEDVSNVEIAGFASVLNAVDVIEEKNPDLVLSIFPIEIVNRPFVKVNPLPTEADIHSIQEEVNKILTHTKTGKVPRLIPRQQIKEKQGIEAESRDILVRTYVIYEELLKAFAEKLTQEYKEAFLLHVMLMVHRITFDSQYESEGNIVKETLLAQQELVEQIERIFAKNDLMVNQAEITALLNYIREEGHA